VTETGGGKIAEVCCFNEEPDIREVFHDISIFIENPSKDRPIIKIDSRVHNGRTSSIRDTHEARPRFRRFPP
jgi:hypothetical protein